MQNLATAYRMALNSPDLSTQNGAIVIARDGRIAMGCNKLPMGVEVTSERLERPKKYLWTEHAERNAIYDAARRGIRTEGATMFCPFIACHDCARAIVQSGIISVVTHTAMQIPGRWSESVEVGFEILNEAGVEIEFISGFLNVAPILFNGTHINP